MSAAPAFMLESPCSRVDPEAMFPAPSAAPEIKFAKFLCGQCRFKPMCLEWALAPESRCDYGVFGGRTEEERKALIKDKQLGKAHRMDYGPKSKRPPVAV